jgi:hypothetical protein
MKRRKRQQPEHESPHEQRLREIVDVLVHDDYQKQAYLAFAREFASSVHRVPAPDFEPGTKRVVMKWFRRGLSGHRLWLIGRALMRDPDSGTAFSSLHR